MFLIGGGADPDAVRASHAPFVAATAGGPITVFVLDEGAETDADKVNAYEPLLARARACERIRNHIPNLLAVNFYKRGDLFRVVDTLNGTG